MVLLLGIIYLAFISLGLPDSLLGSAWPAMYQGLGVSISSAGIVSMIVTAGTIVSSLASDRLIRRMGTGIVTLISVGMTAAALLGISLAGSFAVICLWAIPLGLGAGSVDAALNSFVALHYKASHMNWLHSFWGVGTIVGPIVISFILARSGTWNSAYRVMSIVQFGVVAVLALSLPLWKKAKDPLSDGEADLKPSIGIRDTLKLPKAKPTLISFFCYCSLEQTVMLWGSSYLVIVKGIREGVAAGWVSLFFIGITVGRLLSGFLSMKFTQKHLIWLGELFMGIGICIFLLPLPGTFMVLGLFCIGIGGAPVYPGLMHETPATFGRVNSQAIMGMQMASAYLGSTLMPFFFGLLAARISYKLFPFYLGLALIIMVGGVNMIYAKRSVVKADA